MSAVIAKSIAAALKERGITQADIAKELNVSPAWVSLRLTGAQGSLDDLEAIIAVAKLTPVWRDEEPERRGETTHWYDSSLLRTDGAARV